MRSAAPTLSATAPRRRYAETEVLPAKTAAFINWAVEQSPQFAAVIKVDDDVYIDARRLTGA